MYSAVLECLCSPTCIETRWCVQIYFSTFVSIQNREKAREYVLPNEKYEISFMVCPACVKNCEH